MTVTLLDEPREKNEGNGQAVEGHLQIRRVSLCCCLFQVMPPGDVATPGDLTDLLRNLPGIE